MHLPFFPKSTSHTSQREYFFTLEVDHSQVKSAIWTVVNNKPQVVSIGDIGTWDDQNESSLVNAADTSISSSINKLDTNGKIQPEKVILGLPHDWISEDKIIPEKLRLLRLLGDKLSLNAVGFVVTSEAVIRFVQSQEGVPPTAIIIGVWADYLEVSVIRLGKSEGTQVVKRSTNIVPDVVEGLSRFAHLDMLPSRILLFDSGLQLEDIKQQLLAHSWQSPQTKLPFMHIPKVECSPPGYSVRAISLAGGSEVAQARGLIPPTPNPEVNYPPDSAPQQETPNEFGFIENFDLENSPEPLPNQSLSNSKPTDSQTTLKITQTRKFKFPAFHLPKLPQHSFSPKPKFAFLITTIAILLVAVLLGLAYWFLPSAKVKITIEHRSLQTQFDIITDTQTLTLDSNNSLLPARTIETIVVAEKTSDATGTKLIGDKAAGSVTIVNGTSTPKTFSSGTVLVSPSGLKFILDSDIQVASASGTADPNSYQPGKTTVKITAGQIGSDSNLSAGTQFRIGSYSPLDFVAKNEEAFSGGTSRQVKAISKEDISRLRSEVTELSNEKAKNDILTKVNSEHLIIPESIQIKTQSEDVDHKVDEVADKISLKLTVKATCIEISQSDIKELSKLKISDQIPPDFNLADGISYSFTLKSIDKNLAKINLQVKASVLPKIQETTTIQSITGKKPEAAKNYIQSLPGVTQVEFSFFPNLPLPLLTLPHISKNIHLELVSQQ